MSIDLIFKKCPNCSASLELIPGSEKVQCEFCGSSYLVSTLRTNKDKGEKPDLKTKEFNNDWAQKISEMAVIRFQKQYKIDLAKDSGAMERIVKDSQKVAMELEEEENATLNVPFIAADSSGPLHICEQFTRSDMK